MENTGQSSDTSLVRRLLDGMAGRLNPEAAEDTRATIQFVLSGEGGGDFAIVIRDGACKLIEALKEDADAVMKMSTDTFIDLALGRITGSQGFYSRKIRFSGSIHLIMRMHTLFPPVSKDEKLA